GVETTLDYWCAILNTLEGARLSKGGDFSAAEIEPNERSPTNTHYVMRTYLECHSIISSLSHSISSLDALIKFMEIKKIDGECGNRIHDLVHAKHALYQLS
ncbi:hypothetical protein THAOC_03952, partial [Thalassiosira oceanica]